ncbi:tRNA lysidine(34) synthetase TilS [Aerococcus agrisoli]|uniref:tRNA(Ile)-lysidine synthase n=1 Tax=Aerococcus agrisoli TaxID=2487350 RepID=A0A3N4GEA7_9LACT|nr:tRNA lysidine(34) synthetase TilS [Aerococcus agrisoli]RPA60555.1 tRNA lysidine(34) synthetase TilS [Aerococcus agrisoli]
MGQDTQLTKHLLEWLDQYEPGLRRKIPQAYQTPVGRPRFLLAVSGGVDSMVLLATFADLAKQIDLQFSVIHINHHLRQQSDDEQAMVIDFCESQAIDLQVVEWSHPDPTNPERSELAAREFRYAVFEKIMVMRQAPYLVTAHHLNDQAETVLMRLVHGGRITSVAGIHPTRPIGLDSTSKSGFVLRPLLNVPKADLYDYAASHKIPYMEDASNHDLAFTRNRFRQTIIPVLTAEDDNLLDHLGHFAEASQASQDFAQAYMAQILKDMAMKRDETWKIDLGKMTAFSQAQQILLWQSLFDKIDASLVSFTQVGFERMVNFLNQDTGQGEWQLPGDFRLVKVYDTAYILPKTQVDFFEGNLNQHDYHHQRLLLNTWVQLGNDVQLGRFDQEIAVGSDVQVITQVPAGVDLVVRGRQTGDFIQLSNGHSQKLNRFFINEKIPAGVRDQLVVVADADQVVWAVLDGDTVLYANPSQTGDKVLVKF